MKIRFSKIFPIIAVMTLVCTVHAQQNDNILIELLQSRPELFEQVLRRAEEHELQILYTQIDRDQNNLPSFRTFRFGIDPRRYFYPASTVKLPAAVLALEKLNRLQINGLDKFTPLRIDSSYEGQTAVALDSTASDSLPTIGNYIKKIFLVSDNDAFNRLYEFLGQRELNEALWRKGYRDLRLIHRLSVGMTPEANRHTNAFEFYRGDAIVWWQPAAYSDLSFNFELTGEYKGIGYMSDGELVQQPKDFSQSNFISLEAQQAILKAVLFPEALPPARRFDLSEEEYRFLYKYMSMLPRESRSPRYADTTEYYDSYGKYIMFGDSKERMPAHLRIFNKVGMAYGYLIDNAYVADFEQRVEFLLSAVIYVNRNQILNDDTYEYDEIGLPFLANLGRVIYEHERQRPRPRLPDLRKFIIDYTTGE